MRNWVGLAISFVLLGCNLAKADLGKVVETSYRYVIPENCSQAEAKGIAIDRAILEALSKEFGTEVHSETWSEVRNANSVSNIDTWHLGSSAVKGQWVETIGAPSFTFHSDGNSISVEVRMKGRILPMKEYKIDLDISVLRLSQDGIFKSQRFQSGDRIGLMFSSSAEGDLLIFLADEDGTVAQLLPFASQRAPAARIIGDAKYKFFQDNSGDEEEQYRLFTDKDLERNMLYILFSPNGLGKPVASVNDGLRTISTKAFREWIDKLYSSDNELQIRVMPLTILGN